MVMEPELMDSIIVPAYLVNGVLARLGWNFGRIWGQFGGFGEGGCRQGQDGGGCDGALRGAFAVSGRVVNLRIATTGRLFSPLCVRPGGDAVGRYDDSNHRAAVFVIMPAMQSRI